MQKITYYKIGVSGFSDVEFTQSSAKLLSVPQAFGFAKKRQSTLQSLRDAIAFRIDAGGQDNADCAQWTRTGAIYTRPSGNLCVAFDDMILEAFAERSTYDAHLCDKSIVQAIQRARDTKRFAVVANSYTEIEKSQLETHELLVAAAQDMAAPYARHLNNDPRCHWRNLFFDNTQVKLGQVKVRPVCLERKGDVCLITAHSYFWYRKQARGVRNMTSVK